MDERSLCQAHDELDRAEDHLTDVAYRLARRCDVLEEALESACSACVDFRGGDMEDWRSHFVTNAEAEVAARWARHGLVGGWVFDDDGNVREMKPR